MERRETARNKIASLAKKINNASQTTDLANAQQMSENLETNFNIFSEAHADVLNITGKKELPYQEIEGRSVKELYSEARSALDIILARLGKDSTDTQQSNDPGDDSSSVHLQSLQSTLGKTTSICNIEPLAVASTSGTATKSGNFGNGTSGHPPVKAAGPSHVFPRVDSPGKTDLLAKSSNIIKNAGMAIHRLLTSSSNNTFQNTSIALAQTQVSLLESYWNAFMTATFSDWNEDPDDTPFEQIESEYVQAKANLVAIIESHYSSTRQVAATANIGGISQPRPEIQLPKIEIPKFAGNFQTWNSFFDLFTSMVHNNNSLSDVQRMHYLRASVEGEAENLIRSYKVTGPNYEQAWNALQDRYNNQRLIVNSHLEQLFQIPKSNAESHTTLRRQLDKFSEAVRALTALDQPVNHWNVLLVYILVSKLDSQTKHAWEMTLGDKIFPTFQQLSEFIERRCRSLEAAGQQHTSQNRGSANTSQIVSPPIRTSKPTHNPPRVTMAATTSCSIKCNICKGDHYIGSCKEFRSMSVTVRSNKIHELGLCFNCLLSGHISTQCPSKTSCKKCACRHHSMLHYNNENSPFKKTSLLAVNYKKDVLLATATAIIVGPHDTLHKVRILLDLGSQSTIITERCVQRAGLIRHKASIPISGLNVSDPGSSRGLVEFEFTSRLNEKPSITIQALVLPKITQAIPNSVIDKKKIQFLTHIPVLADPLFYRPGEIDILLGADYLGNFILNGTINDERDHALFAQNTSFGWVVAGPIPDTIAPNIKTLVSMEAHVELEQALRRFWELETLGSFETRTPEEIACEQHFSLAHSRDITGRYIVELPFRADPKGLGNSRNSALRSFLALEQRFKRTPDLREQYVKFIDEYKDLGHMSLSSTEPDEASSFYLPHHPVFKLASTSTKMRVVFDASRKSTSGKSLNDVIMVGPRLQDDLVDILIRFRSHKVALCGDLVKMYRQIRTTPESSEYQRILWRSSPNEEIRTYRLDTVTYGTSSASFLATRALQQLADDEAERFPLASAVTKADFYVDDLITGCDNVSDALALQTQLIGLMTAGGFTISKWSSNFDDLLENIPKEQREINIPLEINPTDAIKALGLLWSPSSDCFQFQTTLVTKIGILTKRSVLSEIASIFDPLGFLAPLVISAKIFIQSLWAEGVDWDQPLPKILADRWCSFRDDLPAINVLKIPRWIGIHGTKSHQLHGFCDASEAAYAAVVYIRSTDPLGEILVHLVAAKTKVAPTKKISIPRLELCGAVLLADLMAHVKFALKLADIESHAWCDSSVAVAWIHKPSYSWHTFVANRVSHIHQTSDPHTWSHIPGNQNPADFASRGLTASQLVRTNLWWQGPDWLTLGPDMWPRMREPCSTTIDEKKATLALHVSTHDPLEILHRFSSFDHLRRITALLLRFSYNCRRSKEGRRTGFISTDELSDAANRWALSTQSLAFPEEISYIKTRGVTPAKGPLKSLRPFIDKNGLLRVGGRIDNANIAFEARHPIILPKTSHLTDLLVTHTHLANMHSGTQLTIATLRQRYWIISARGVTKKHIRRCPSCIRHAHTPGRQMMADLPERRIQPTRAFASAGVDYAGPFTIKLQPGRGTKTSKAYIALFICFATKAIHLELVSSLTTDAFLAAFRRFVARRGKCADLHSDCGTNFVGACKELKSLHQTLMQQFGDSTLASILAVEGTRWHFNPPGAPNFGGLWEAGVKSTKHHLRRVLTNTLLTFEEFYTILTQVEAILNSRPISPLSDDPDDPQALTPGHFLIGEAMNSPADPFVAPHTSPHRRWQYLQLLTQHFWRRWRLEYVTSLQHRYKWVAKNDNIMVGALALIVDENLPPCKWSLGRVITLHPGSDGLVRVVTLKHKGGLIKRPIRKLCFFPNTQENTNNTHT